MEIIVYDADLNYDSEEFEQTLSHKLSVYQNSEDYRAKEVNLGAGADWPAIAIEFIDKHLLYASALALFFSGKKIIENLKAWSEIANRIRAIFSRGALNSGAAAALCLERLSKEQILSAQLIAYFEYEIDYSDLSNDTHLKDAVQLVKSKSSIEMTPKSLLQLPALHCFRVKADSDEYICIVQGTEVTIEKL